MNAPAIRFDEHSDAASEWTEHRLGDVLIIKYGKDHKHIEDGNIPVYGTGGVMRYGDTSIHSGPAIILGRKGTIDKPQYAPGPFWSVDTTYYCVAKGGHHLPFLHAVVNSIDWKKHNEASGVPSLSSTTIQSIKVRLPSHAEQVRIADAIAAVDAKIELLSRKREAISSFKAGLMQQLFSQAIKFPLDNDAELGGGAVLNSGMADGNDG